MLACYTGLVTTVTCQHCGKLFEAQRKTRKFCSTSCSNRSAWVVTKTRLCRHCGKNFPVSGAGDQNRQHCSKECAKNHNAKRVSTWQAEHPDSMGGYNATRVAKNPGVWRDKAQSERQRIIKLLGGCCVVCGADNPAWLHADYIPTTRADRFRHPRHYAYVARNREQFRLLCANHHYELTLTGAIEGTSITQ